MNRQRALRISARILKWIGGALAALALVTLATILIVRTAWFENYVRGKIIAVTEESTGGQVGIGSFKFEWRRLEATAGDFVLHGNETGGSPPLVRARTVTVRLKLLAGLKRMVDLEYLGIDQLAANVIVSPDGRTNIPEPKVPRKSNQSALDTIVDLAIHKFELTNGSLAFAQQSIPIEGRGEDLRVQLFYRALPAGYQGELHVGRLQITQAYGRPVTASLDAPVTIGKDSIGVANARIATRDSQIVINASVSNMASPVISAHAIAHVSLAEVQRAANLAAAGIRMDPCRKNTPCFGDADVELETHGDELRISSAKLNVGRSSFEASGAPNQTIQFNGKIALDEVARLFRASSPVDEVVTLSGDARISDARDISMNGKIAGFGGEFTGHASLADFARFELKGDLRDLKLGNLEKEFLSTRASAEGYDGVLRGPITASGTFKAPGVSGLRAEASLSIAPSISPESHGVPVSGQINAIYDGASDSLNLGRSYLELPHSRIGFAGVLGRHLDVDLSSTNTGDFHPALAMAMKQPPAGMPFALRGGKVELNASVDGSLASPSISGHVLSDRFSVEQRNFDRVSADFTASATGASIEHATLQRQTLLAQLSGSVGLRAWSFDNESAVRLTFDLRNGDIADALALAGENEVPVKGSLTASAQITGSLGNPQGAVQVAAANGVAYDQQFDKADARIELADGIIRLVSLDVAVGAGRIEASGTYSHPRDRLLPGRAQVTVNSSAVDLSQFALLRKLRPGLSGAVQLNASGTIDVREVSGAAAFNLDALRADVSARTLRDNAQGYGDLTAHAESAGSNLNFHLDSNLTGATIRVSGSTTLPGTNLSTIARAAPGKDYPLSADIAIQNLNLESALALAGESFPARGALSLNGHFSGTLTDPTGRAQVNLARAAIYDEPIDTLQADVQYVGDSVEVSNLRAASPAGSIAANASLAHPVHQFDRGRLQLRAESTGLRLARVHFLNEQEPGLDGTLKFSADASGEVRDNHGHHEVLFSKLDGNLALNQVTYNGHAFGDATLTSQTKTGAVALKFDSDFASASIHGEGEATLQPDLPIHAKITAGNIRYSNLRGFFKTDSVRPDFDVLLDAQASLDGPAMHPSELRAAIEVPRLDLTTQASARASAPTTIAVANDGAISADFDHSVLRIRTAHLTGRSTDITVTGSAGFTGANRLDLSVKATTDLNLIEQIDREVHAHGAIAVDAAVHGSPSQPLVNGSVRLTNGAFNLESIPNGISNANGVIALNGSSARITNLTAESGGGKVTFTGFSDLTGSTARYSLHASVLHVRTRYQGVTVVNSANLTLGGVAGRGVINGTVTVERVGFNPQSDIGSLLAQLTARTAPGATTPDNSGPLAGVRLDIRVRTASGVRFETTFAETLEGQGDLSVTGTLARPGAVGRIEITQGDMVFFGNEYMVNRGVISFYNPLAIDPQIDISLETTVLSVSVTIGVSGPMDNLKLTYHSDPPLQFQEIVSLLANGRRPSSDPTIVENEAAPPQQSLGQMGETAIVGQAVASPLASRLQRVFGVSELKVDPTFVQGSTLPQATLTLQQRVSNAITFTYSQNLSLSNSELIRVEWALSSRVSAVATRDENGIFGVDFFYKLQFR